MKWILKLPQLRSDMLSMYKIPTKDYKDDRKNKKENKNFVIQTDYLQLFKYTMNRTINKWNKERFIT